MAAELATLANQESDFTFDPATGTITAYTGTLTDVVIPETIGGVTVTTLGKNSFLKKGLTSIVFNEGLEVIGEGAFSGNATLSSADFPSTLRRIEKGAFILAGFTSVELNEGLEYLGQYAFSNNKQLLSINLPSTLTKIDNLVFNGSSLLTGEFVLGQALGHVGHRVFYKTGTPVTISIAAGDGNKLYLHDELFAAGQTSLTIPQDRLIMVFARSFAPLTDITLDAGQIDIKSDMTAAEIEAAINEAVLLTTGFAIIDSTIPDGSGDVYVETGIDWQTDGLDLSQSSIVVSGSFQAFPAGTPGSTAVDTATLAMAYLNPQVTLNVETAFPAVEADFTFDPATGTITGYVGTLTDVVIPETIGGIPVIALGKNAFYKKGLTSIIFNEGLEVIGEGALSGNATLTSAQFPSSLRRIEKGAFILAGFTSVELNEGLEYLGQNAFANNKKLTSINLPSTLEQIDNLVFNGSSLLTGEFVLGQALGHVGHRVFYKTGTPVTISIADGDGNKLYLHDELFAAGQTSLAIPQDRSIMVFARSFAPLTDIALNAGQIDIQSDMTAAEIEAAINEAVLLTTGFAIIDSTIPDGSGDVYVETGIDWQTDGLDLSQSSILVTGSFQAFPAGTPGGTAVDTATGAMAYLKPQVTLKVEQVVQSFQASDFTYATIYKNNVPGNYYFGITGFSPSGLAKAVLNKELILPSEVKVEVDGVAVAKQITGIGENAFANAGLTAVTLPELAGFSDFIIDSGAFAGNQLTALDIPYGVKIIETSAFKDNEIAALYLPATILKVGNEAFYNNKIATLTISDDVKMLQLDNYSFANNLIKSVDMPYSIFKALGNVFRNNPGMETVDETYGVVYLYTRNPAHLEPSTYIFSSEYQKFILVGESEARKELYKVLKQIDSLESDDYTEASWQILANLLPPAKAVFADSSATSEALLSQVEILNSALAGLTPVGVNKKDLAGQVSRLSELPAALYTPETHGRLLEVLEIANGLLVKGDATQGEVDQALAELLLAEKGLLIAEGYRWTPADFTYDGQTITGYSASGQTKFSVNKALVLPEKTPEGLPITGIAADAFAIPTDDVMFGSDSVTSLTGLTSVVLPKSLKTIGDNAFRYNALTLLHLPDGLQAIGATAFNGNQLTGLWIPDTVTEMGNGAFSLNLITTVKFSKGMTVIPNGILSRNVTLTSVVIPEGVTEIGSAAFTGAPLKSLSLPTTLKIIRSRAFLAHRLETVVIPRGVEIIELSAFEQNLKWRTMKQLTLNEGLLEIGSNAFKSGLLTEVTIPYSLAILHDKAFSNNLNDLKQEIPVTVYTYNPAHVEAFAGSASHEIILLALNKDDLTDLLEKAKQLQLTDAFTFDELADQTRLIETIAQAAAFVENPTSPQLMKDLVDALDQAMAQINGVKPGETDPDPGTTTPGSTTPGHTTPGHTTPGHTTPGHTTPGHTTPGQKPDRPSHGKLPYTGQAESPLPLVGGLLLLGMASVIVFKKTKGESA